MNSYLYNLLIRRPKNSVSCIPQNGRAKILAKSYCEWIFRDYFLTLFSTPGVNFYSHSLVVSQSGRKGRNEFCFAKPRPNYFSKYFLWSKMPPKSRRALKRHAGSKVTPWAQFLCPVIYIGVDPIFDVAHCVKSRDEICKTSALR